MAGRTVSPVFVGRADELSRLRAAHRRAVDRRPASVIVSGEAGIGKSRLVAELLSDLDGSSDLALVGRCAPHADASLPYAPFLEALRHVVPRGGRLDVLRLLAPALDGAGSARVSTGQEPADGSGRIGAFAAILDLLERKARRSTVVLVVEDLHWAGPSTTDLHLHVARNAPPGLLLVTTVRQPEADTRQEIDRLMPELLRQEGAELVELDALDRVEVASLVSEIVEGPPRPELLDDVAFRSGGNPLYVEELCAAALRGKLDTVAGELRQLVLSRTDGLGSDAQRLLEVAAAADDALDLSLAVTAAELDPGAGATAVGELVARGIMVVDPSVRSRARFRHSIVREVLYARLPEARRRAVHRKLAVALGRKGGHSLPPGRSAALAHHWQEAGHPVRALPYLLASGEEAVRAFALDEAATAFHRAIEIMEEADYDPRRAEDRLRVYLRAADVAATAGQPDEAERILERAEALSRHAGERFLVRERRAGWSWHAGDERRAYSIWSELVEGERPSPAASAEAQQALARALMYLARFEEAAPIAQAAVDKARAEGRGELEADGLITLGMALLQSDRIEEGLEAFRRAGRRAAELRSVRHLRPAYSMLVGMAAEAERFDEAIAAGREYLETTRRLKVPEPLRHMGLENYIYALQLVGRWDEVTTLLEETLAQPLPDRALAGLLLSRATLRCQRGDFDGTKRDLEEIAIRAPGMAQHSMVGAVHAIRAEMAIWEGNPDAARHEVDAGLSSATDVVQAQEDMYHELTLLGMRVEADEGLRQQTVPWARRSDQPMRRATRLMAKLRQRRRQRKPSYTLYRGLIAGTFIQTRAEARRLKGRAATSHWRRASDLWAGLHRPYLEAYARMRLAESLAAESEGALEVAKAVARALEISTRLGALPLRREVELVARRLRINTEDVTRPTEIAAGIALTPRERQVLRLLVAGLSNREIGNELGIAEKTTEIHVSNVLRKLGVERRVEAAMLAVQLGIVPLDTAVVGASDVTAPDEASP